MAGTSPTTLSTDRNDRAPKRILLALAGVVEERVAGVARYAREAGWTLDCRLLHFAGSEAWPAFKLTPRAYDGILSRLPFVDANVTRLLARPRVPVVELSGYHAGDGKPRVILDNVGIGQLGADYLLARGFRDLVFYSIDDDLSALDRIQGVSETAAARQATLTTLVWTRRPPAEAKVEPTQWIVRALRKLRPPFAVMCKNDRCAVDVLEACQIAGIRVPEQVAVLGVDNTELVTELGPIPISSIATNRERAGYEAAALLDRLMHGKPAPAAPILIAPQGVITRRSTDVMAVRNADVAEALAFIADHLREPISVNDVATQASVSRRRLQDLFTAELGRTIADEITRQRLALAQKQLVETSDKASVIARRVGFSSGKHMRRAFSRTLDSDPTTYRHQHRPAS